MSATKAALAPSAHFLGIGRSFTGKAWKTRACDDSVAARLARAHDLPDAAARVLAGRGIGLEAAGDFLSPTLKAFFPDPSSFADMDEAVRVLADAIECDRPTAVIADYDVDGGTSAALLVRYFRARGRSLRIYVPDRLLEGYGPSALAFERLKAEGVELVVTVDCGASAQAALAAAADLKLDVVVLDHHLMSGPAPPARAVVNPNRPDCPSGQGHLTAAGVVLVALAGLNRELRRRQPLANAPEPDLRGWLDLAALGTICDVAPLVGFNRAVVSRGLKILSENGNPGFAALARKAGLEKADSVYHAGFVLGPRLNAGGRIGESALAARILSTDDPIEAAELAVRLDALNSERRAIEAAALEEAIGLVEAQARDSANPLILVGKPHWHPGIIGIVAGRLKERCLKPVIVLGGEGEIAKGSGRSIPGVNLGAAIAKAVRAGLAPAGGGHAMAAGVSAPWDRAEALADFLREAMREEFANAPDTKEILVDGVVAIGSVDFDLHAALARIGPYGQGNPEPLFAFCEVRALWARQVGADHVSATLEDAFGRKIRAIAFRSAQNALGQALTRKQGGRLHVLARLKKETYQGQDSLQLDIVDGAPA